MQKNDVVSSIIAIEEKVQQHITANRLSNQLKITKLKEANLKKGAQALATRLTEKDANLKKQVLLNEKEVKTILTHAHQEATALNQASQKKIDQAANKINQRAKELLCP